MPDVRPSRESDRFTNPLEGKTVVDPAIVAEQIEAGYDLQADAAVKPMSDNPASSSQGEVFDE